MNILIFDEKKEFVEDWKERLLKFISDNPYIKMKLFTSIE